MHEAASTLCDQVITELHCERFVLAPLAFHELDDHVDDFAMVLVLRLAACNEQSFFVPEV